MTKVIMLTSHASSPSRAYDDGTVAAMGEAWLCTQPEISGLRVGYLVATTGAAAAPMATELGVYMRRVCTPLFRIDPTKPVLAS